MVPFFFSTLAHCSEILLELRNMPSYYLHLSSCFTNMKVNIAMMFTTYYRRCFVRTLFQYFNEFSTQNIRECKSKFISLILAKFANSQLKSCEQATKDCCDSQLSFKDFLGIVFFAFACPCPYSISLLFLCNVKM